MIKILIPILLLTGSLTFAQTQSFSFPVPESWEGEEIPFPIEFAPNIPYEGIEYARFTPGWGEPESDEHWSYCFLWWIDDDAKIDVTSLNRDIMEYYSGLVGRNVISRNIDSSLVVPTIVKFKQGGPHSFTGTVNMLDYHTSRPMVLNITTNITRCNAAHKLAVFFAVSPQPRSSSIWQTYEKVRDGIRCDN
jgi:hypothetical protein